MTKEEFKLALNNAIKQREKQDTNAALDELENLVDWAKDKEEHSLACEAMTHAIICHQHRADLGLDEYEIMAEEAEEGVYYASVHPAAFDHLKNFHFRLGVARFMQDRYREAAPAFGKALSYITKSDNDFPELASYFGIASYLNGNRNAGMHYLSVAQLHFGRLTSQDPPAFEPWHAKIIECGLHMRFAMMWHAQGDTGALRVAMTQAKALADELYNTGITMRMVQYKNLEKKLGYQPRS